MRVVFTAIFFRLRENWAIYGSLRGMKKINEIAWREIVLNIHFLPTYEVVDIFQ